jgi:autotransporter-associated beta strand protein
VISGSGAFQQNGSGATILAAANTYSGATTVDAGTLSVDDSTAVSGLTRRHADGHRQGRRHIGRRRRVRLLGRRHLPRSELGNAADPDNGKRSVRQGLRGYRPFAKGRGSTETIVLVPPLISPSAGR